MRDQDYKDRRTEVSNRKGYTRRLYLLMVCWMSAVLVIITASGLKVGWAEWIPEFELPESVLLALIGGTTANVIGLFLVVAKYLFPRRNNDR